MNTPHLPSSPKESRDMARSRWIAVVLVLIVIAIPILYVTWSLRNEEHLITVNENPTLTQPQERLERLLTVNGTLIEGAPVDYLRSEQFVPKTHQLKIVLTLRANQPINATIEVARIVGYMIVEDREGPREARIFGLYPETVMNRTTWDFHKEYSKTKYVPLYSIPAEQLGRTPVGLEIEIFLEGPNHASNPTFLVFWDVTVYNVY
jgi:hypothetical protein